MKLEIRDFGQRSFVTHTTGLVERIQKMTEQELLAVLDMSEDSPEQYGWLLSTIREHGACCPADLAFRLRDEVIVNEL